MSNSISTPHRTRAEAPAQGAHLRFWAPSARVLAAPLLATAMAGLMLLADQLFSAWADGQLFLAWLALWMGMQVGFAWHTRPAQVWSRASWTTSRDDQTTTTGLAQKGQSDFVGSMRRAEGCCPAPHLHHL